MLDLGRFSTAERTTGGYDTAVWRVRLGGRSYALRVFRPEQATAMRRELSALRAAARGGIAVPQIRAIGPMDDGRPATLMDWCPGRVLFESVASVPAWRVLVLGVQFGRMQRRIHAVPAPPGLRATWLDWPSPIGSARLRARLEAASRGRRMLLHLDFHPLNVLVEGNRVSAVLDWVNAHAGDPRADVARTLTILRFAPSSGAGAEKVGVSATHVGAGASTPDGGSRGDSVNGGNSGQRVNAPRGGEQQLRRLLELGWRAGYGPFGPHMPLFYAWAGLAMQDDLTGRVPAEALEPVARWTAAWLRHIDAELAPGSARSGVTRTVT